ncbi:hypothetical protein [Massilia sp. METH4]|uniref:hypothetical protein n=1 Tax=Massilia sp. METH4 TaxID=3123041 RepID=UPI0030CB5023
MATDDSDVQDAPSFLLHLGLASDADERSIRRAYARQLKQIDQDREVEAFTRLRAAYEHALAWAAMSGEPVAQEDHAPAPAAPSAALETPEVPHAAVPLPDATVPDATVPDATVRDATVPDGTVPDATVPHATLPAPGEAAAEEYGRFDAVFDALVEEGTPGLRPAVDALRRSLASDALVNLDEAAAFELHLAARLADGWRPGHELLLPAACEVFGWEQDLSRLARMAGVGLVLHHALDEKGMLDSLPADEIEAQEQVLLCLRHDAQLDGEAKQRLYPAFMRLGSGAPMWLRLVAPAEVAARWRQELHKELQQARLHDELTAGLMPPSKPTPLFLAVLPLLVMVTLVLLLVAARSRSSTLSQSDIEQTVTSSAQPGPAGRTVLPDEYQQRIQQGIDYPYGPAGLPHTATYEVFLDANKDVLSVFSASRGKNVGYDAAVEQAVRKAQPYPADMAAIFTVTVARPQ